MSAEDKNSLRRGVTIQLDEDVVKQILLVKALYKERGRYFSVSSVCEKALARQVVHGHTQFDRSGIFIL
ncbi:MAG: hypothetical protein HOM11_10895 [Methylococcales bacterium]|jgi:hypothetical protein|nr:hypothetical protein [Methylococcales bacterium]MBT7442884.1 hypothetical protein [Methylococcales bacterium]